MRQDHRLCAGLIQPTVNAVKHLDLELESLQIWRRLALEKIGPVVLAEIDLRGRIYRKTCHVQAKSPVQNRVVGHVAKLPQAPMTRCSAFGLMSCADKRTVETVTKNRVLAQDKQQQAFEFIGVTQKCAVARTIFQRVGEEYFGRWRLEWDAEIFEGLDADIDF